MKLSSPLSFTCALAIALGAFAMGPTFAAGNAFPPASSLQDTAPSSAPTDVSGSWQVSYVGRQGNRQATLQIKQDGAKLSGSFEAARGSAPLSGKLNGKQVSFTVKMPRRKVSFTGTIDGDKMSGTTEQGTSWSATRQ